MAPSQNDGQHGLPSNSLSPLPPSTSASRLRSSGRLSTSHSTLTLDPNPSTPLRSTIGGGGGTGSVSASRSLRSRSRASPYTPLGSSSRATRSSAVAASTTPSTPRPPATTSQTLTPTPSSAKRQRIVASDLGLGSTPVRSPSMKAIGGLLGFISPFSRARARGSAAFGVDEEPVSEAQQDQALVDAQSNQDEQDNAEDQQVDIEAQTSFDEPVPEEDEEEEQPFDNRRQETEVDAQWQAPATQIIPSSRGLRSTDYASPGFGTSPYAPPPRVPSTPFTFSQPAPAVQQTSFTGAALDANGATAPSYDSLLRFYAQHAPHSTATAANSGITFGSRASEQRGRSPSLPLGAAAGEESGVGYTAYPYLPPSSNGLPYSNGHGQSSTVSQNGFGALGTSSSLSEGLWRGVAERREAGMGGGGIGGNGSARGSFLSPHYVSPNQGVIQAAQGADRVSQAQDQALNRSLAASFSPAALARRGAASGSTVPPSATAGRRHRPLYLGPGMAGSSSLAAMRRRRRGGTTTATATGISGSATVGNLPSMSSTSKARGVDDDIMDLDEFGREQRPERPDPGKRRRVEPGQATSDQAQQLPSSVFGNGSVSGSAMTPSWTTPDLPSFARSQQSTAQQLRQGENSSKPPTSSSSPAKPLAASPPRTATADAVLSILSSGPPLAASTSRNEKKGGKSTSLDVVVNPYQASSGLRGRLSNGDAEDGSSTSTTASLSTRQKLLRKQKEEEKERRRKEREESRAREGEAKGNKRNGGERERESALDIIQRTAPGRSSRVGVGREKEEEERRKRVEDEGAKKEQREKEAQKDKKKLATEEAKRRLEALQSSKKGQSKQSTFATGAVEDDGKGREEDEEEDVPAAPLFSFGVPPPSSTPAKQSITSAATATPSKSSGGTTTSKPTVSNPSSAPTFSFLSSSSTTGGKPNAFAPKKPSPLSLAAFGATATPPDSPDERSNDAEEMFGRTRERREGSPSAELGRKDREVVEEEEEEEEGKGDKENDKPTPSKNLFGNASTSASTSTGTPSVMPSFSFGSPVGASTSAPSSKTLATAAMKPLQPLFSPTSSASVPASGSGSNVQASDIKSQALSTPIHHLPTFEDLVKLGGDIEPLHVQNEAQEIVKKVREEEKDRLPKFEFSVRVGVAASQEKEEVGKGTEREGPTMNKTTMQGFSFSPAPASNATTTTTTTTTTGGSSGFNFGFSGTQAQAGSGDASADSPSTPASGSGSGSVPIEADASASASASADPSTTSTSGSALLSGLGAGEEDEITLHTVRGKVYLLSNGAWSDLGIGNVKVKSKEEGGGGGKKKKRLLVRNEGNGKVTVNFSLYPSLKVTREKNVLSFLGFTPDEGKPANYRLRVKTEDMAKEMAEVLEREKEGV